MLTTNERRALLFIACYHDANGLPPTFREVQAALGYRSKSAVHGLVQRLTDKGYVTYQANKSRTLRLVREIVRVF